MEIKNNLVLINASNLHNGGGVQVAISFLYELSVMDNIDLSLFHVCISTEVADGLASLNTDISVFGRYDLLNIFGIKGLYSKLNTRIKKYSVVFTVFGPNYLRAKSQNEIVGFAQAWIITFDNPVSEKLSFISRNKLRVKFNLQWFFFLRSDHYIVELEHVKESLHYIKAVNRESISVIHNTVSSLYNDKSKWQSVNIVKGEEAISLGIVTRDYSHKNLNILPSVAKILELKHNLRVHFYTTLNDEEWSTKDASFRKHVSTVGSLLPNQCPSFYQQVDGVIFPSLLECFSATPLEAMVMSKPLFASDLGFVRNVCGDYITYFDPLNSEDIALSISRYFNKKINRLSQLQEARNHALNFSTAKGRAEQYLKIIQQHLEG